MDDFGSKCAQYSVQMQSVSRAHTESLIKFVAPNRRSKKKQIQLTDTMRTARYHTRTVRLLVVYDGGLNGREVEKKYLERKIYGDMQSACNGTNWIMNAEHVQMLRCCWCGPTAYDDVSRADATVATIPTECYANYSAPLFFHSSFISVSLYVTVGKKIDSLNIVNYGWMGAWFLCVCVLFRHGRSIFFCFWWGTMNVYTSTIGMLYFRNGNIISFWSRRSWQREFSIIRWQAE